MPTRPALLATLVALGGAPLLASICLTTQSAEASTSVELSMSDLVGASTLIVAGTPLDSRSQWEDNDGTGRRIVTYTRVRIDRTIDGTPRPDAWIRTLGGEVDDIGQQVAGEAVLRPGQPALLFLRGRADGTHAVTGMAQGQYLLETGPASGTARVRSPVEAGQLFPKVGPSAAAHPSARLVLVGQTLDEIARRVAAERRAHAP